MSRKFLESKSGHSFDRIYFQRQHSIWFQRFVNFMVAADSKKPPFGRDKTSGTRPGCFTSSEFVFFDDSGSLIEFTNAVVFLHWLETSWIAISMLRPRKYSRLETSGTMSRKFLEMPFRARYTSQHGHGMFQYESNLICDWKQEFITPRTAPDRYQKTSGTSSRQFWSWTPYQNADWTQNISHESNMVGYGPVDIKMSQGRRS